MVMGLLTEELVREALDLAIPSIEAVLKNEKCLWGPRCVVVAVTTGLGSGIYIMRTVNKEDNWDNEWSDLEQFRDLAVAKMALARREGLPTGVIIAQKPWLLQERDCLFQGGVAEEPNSIAVGASGLKSEADEGVAWVVFGFITMLCKLKERDLREKDIDIL